MTASVFGTVRDSLRLLATRRFGTFWFSSLLSSVGTWAQQVAEPWLLLTLGASSLMIGLDSFAANAPVWLLMLVGGALADRADRRRVIALFQSIQMLCPIAIVVLLVTGTIKPWMIIVLSVVVGVTDALSMPSFQSIVPSLVARDQIGRGLALNSTQFNLSRILGPSVAGVLIASVGTVACFVVSAVSYIPFIGVALWILPRRQVQDPPPAARQGGNPFLGIGTILRDRNLRGVLATVLSTGVLCSPLVTFSPVLVREAFHGGASHFSTAVAAFGVGGLVGAACLLGIPASIDRGKLSSSFALVYGAIVVLTALCPWFWGLLPLLVLAGAAMTVSNTAANTLLQATVAPHLLGKTVSLFMLAMRGGISVGALVTGITLGFFGARHAFLINGLLALTVHGTLARTWLRAPTAA